MILSNLDSSDLYHSIIDAKFEMTFENKEFVLPGHFLVNDLLMSIFFLLVGIEIKKEMISGHLALRSQRILPVLCAIFGVITPLIIYLLLNYKTPNNLAGWAIPTATDIAFTIAVMAVFSNKIPQSIRVFVTALAIIDDLIAVIAIAIFYTDTLNFLAIGGIVLCTLLLYSFNKRKIVILKPYIVIGIVMLILFAFSGIHMTVSGVILGFCIPTDSGQRLAKSIHPLVTYLIMPVFAFFNAGVSLEGFSLKNISNPVVSGVFLGLFLGKQIGIFSSFFFLVKSRIASMPAKAALSDAYIASVLCGIGFTMSLFISALAFYQGSSEMVEAKAGILLGSLMSCLYGSFMLRIKKIAS